MYYVFWRYLAQHCLYTYTKSPNSITCLHDYILYLDVMFISVTGFSAGSDHSMQSKVFEKRRGPSVLHTSVDVCPSDSKRPRVPQVSLEVCF